MHLRHISTRGHQLSDLSFKAQRLAAELSKVRAISAWLQEKKLELEVPLVKSSTK